MKNYLEFLEPDNLLQFRLERLSKYIAVALLVIGTAALASWQWHIGGRFPPFSMNAMTASGFILISISFLLLAPPVAVPVVSVTTGRKKTVMGRLLAVILLLVGLLQLSEKIVGSSFSLFPYSNAPDIGPAVPGLMTISSAVCFTLAGMSLLLLNTVTKARWMPAHFMAVAIGMLGLFSMVSYLYQVRSSYGPLRYTPMGAHTAACFMLFAVSVLAANPGKGIMQGFTCNCTGGHMSRRLLPLVLLLPVILGYLRLTGYWKGRFSGEFLATAIVLNIIVIFVSIIWYNTYLLNKKDAQRKEYADLLLESEKRYHLLVSSVKDYAIFMVDPKGYVVSWNDGAERIKGYLEQEILGKHISIFYTSEGIQEAEPEKNLLMARQNSRFETGGWRVRKDGTLFWADISLTALYGPQMKMLGFTNVTRDSTERKQAAIERKLLERQLQQFNNDLEMQVTIKTAELTGIFDRINDIFIAMDEKLRYTYLNKKAGELIRLDPASLLGKHVWDVFPDAIGSAVYHAFNKAMTEQKNSTITAYHPHLDVWLEYHLYPSPEGLSAFIRNITEQIKSGKEITDYKFALDQSSIVSIADKNGIIKHVNENFCTSSKITAPELLGQDHRIVNSGYHPASFMENLRSTIAAGQVWKGEICNKAKDGTLYWLDTAIFPFLDENGEPDEYLAISSDITERKKKEVEFQAVTELLQRSYHDIRQQPSHLQEAREEERAGIAREIHDELGQQLTGIKMDLSWIAKKVLAQPDNDVRLKVNGALELLDATIKTVRKIATELRPGILYDVGLVAAIEWQSQEFQTRSGIPCQFLSNLPEFKGPGTVAIGLFRICQESLTNIARHSEAGNVQISLQENDDRSLLLKIEDDGKGFHPDDLGRKKTLGLLGMKERTVMMGGHFWIASVPGGGTSLSVTIPSNT